MIEGYATTEGTKRFMSRLKVKESHIKSINQLFLTSVGMGTYLGSPSKEEDEMIINAIKISLSRGAMNVIDTAINYRSQRSERAIGKAISEMISKGEIRRDEVFISSKNGYITDDADLNMDIWRYIQTRFINTGIIKPEDISSSYHCMKVSYLEDQLERSRRNLGLECIDLIYLHNPIESQVYDVGRERFMEMLKEVFELYERKRDEGKIRYYGLATWNSFRVREEHIEHLNLYDIVSIAKSIREGHGFRFIQLPFNMLMHEALTLRNQHIDGETLNIIEAASRLGIGVFSSVPLMQGKLLNKIRYEGLAPALLAMQFTRSTGVIPLVGQKREEHVIENIKIAEIEPFDSKEFKELFGYDLPLL